MRCVHALNLMLEGEQEFSSSKGHFCWENVSLYWNLTEGTTATAKGTLAIAHDIICQFCFFLMIVYAPIPEPGISS